MQRLIRSQSSIPAPRPEAEQGHARDAVPTVADGQGVDPPRREAGVRCAEQRLEAVGPAVELGEHRRRRCFGVGEVDAVEPVRCRPQGGVDVQAAVGLVMREEALALGEREERTTSDDGQAVGMTRRSIEEVGFDEGDAGVGGPGIRDERTDAGPGSVGAHEQVSGVDAAVREGDLVPAVTQWPCGRDLVTPADGGLGQRVEQEITQLAAVDLGTASGAVVGLFPVHGGVLVEYAGGLAAGMDQGTEAVVETGGAQGRLAVVFVDVEHAALGPGVPVRLQVEDGGFDAVDVQDAGQGQAAESGADDGDGVMGVHGGSWCVGMSRRRVPAACVPGIGAVEDVDRRPLVRPAWPVQPWAAVRCPACRAGGLP